MDEYAVVWIDTDAKFHVRSFEHEESAVEAEEMLSESGLPTLFISRDYLITRQEDMT